MGVVLGGWVGGGGRQMAGGGAIESNCFVVVFQGLVDVPSEIGAQVETDGSATAELDDAHHLRNGSLFGCMDTQCTTAWRNRSDGYHEIHTMQLQLVGSQPRHR